MRISALPWFGDWSTSFPTPAHVHELGLGSADDNMISKFAREHDYGVVTKDADFRALRLALRSRVQAIRAMAADETGIVDIL